MSIFRRRGLAALVLSLLATGAQAQVLIGSGAPAVQNFDSLANTGSTNTTMPTGWFFSEPGSNGQYVAGTGAGTGLSGSVYSFGSAGSGERALGSVASGSTAPTIGAQLRNDTGAPLTALRVAFTMEQWRLGAPGGADKLTFAYSTSATSLTTGTWTPVPALDAVAVTTAGTAESALDGNAAANRSAITFDIEGLAVAAGATVWIRWSDFNDDSFDDGIAIDDVSLGLAEDTAPTVQSTQPEDGDLDVAVATQIEIVFSEPVTLDEAGVALACDAVAQPAQLQGSGTNFVLAPDASLPYGADCLLTIDAAAVEDVDGATLDAMEADFSLAFSTVADLPPGLASSTPTDGSATFPANASLQLTFSEAVSTGANWFQILCSASGTRAVADTNVTGGPVAFTINPAADFTQGENCTLALDAAQILDQDGTPDPYAGDTAIAFVPAAPVVNQLPVVLSTTPMQGANDFPAFGDLVVLFSEPVTLAPGAFALSCTASPGIVLSHASTGTSFTIDTGTALAANDDCTFTIDRTKVQDAEGASPAADTVVAFSVAASASGAYYNQVNTSSAEQLRCSLHETIKGHTQFGYGWDQLEVADEDPNNPGKILDIYRNCSFTKVDSRVGNGGAATTCGAVSGLRYNREHVWPRSLGFNNGQNNLAAHNDLHMLHLSDEGHNADRGNKPFAYCTKASGCLENRTVTNNGDAGGDGTYPGNSNWYTSTDGNTGSYEVWHRWRGNMARAIFYMAIRYEGIASETAHDGDIPDLELTNDRSLIIQRSNTAPLAHMGLLSVLLEWHQQDPVDARELERNEIVFGFQGNRNPFVDHPEWATNALFTSGKPANCVLGGGGNTAPSAVDDQYAAMEDTVLSVAALDGVLDNDTDAQNDALTAQLVAQAINGTVALAANGGFTYTPNANACGADQFTYRAFDGQALSAVAIARVTVACVNDSPSAANATFAVAENSGPGTVVGTVVASDVDAGSTLAFAIPSGNVGNAFAISASGQITVANAVLDFEARPQFTLTVSVTDNGTPQQTAHATVVVNVGDVDEGAAVANDDAYTVDEDSAATAFAVLANDVADPDSQLLEVVAVSAAANGTSSFTAGSAGYAPAADFCGTDSFTYTVNGGDTATVAVTVTCLDEPPEAIFADGFEG